MSWHTRRSFNASMLFSASAVAASPFARGEAPVQQSAASAIGTPSPSADLQQWPQGYDPKELGTKVAQHFLTSPHFHPDRIVYPEVCAWYGALELARLTSNSDLLSKLQARFDPLFSTEAALLPPSGQHVDFSMFGSLPLEFYILTKDKRYLNLGLKYADAQWSKPDAQGLTDETRFWVDDMYMITIVQTQAYRAVELVRSRANGTVRGRGRTTYVTNGSLDAFATNVSRLVGDLDDVEQVEEQRDGERAANDDNEQTILAHPDAKNVELALQRIRDLHELLRGSHDVVGRRHRHEHQPDGEQYLVEMTPGVDMDVKRALQQAAEQRRRQEGEGQPERKGNAEAVDQDHGAIAAHHGERAVSEIDEVHQAERDGQAARQHEQQHAVGNSVEQDGQHDRRALPKRAS